MLHLPKGPAHTKACDKYKCVLSPFYGNSFEMSNVGIYFLVFNIELTIHVSRL